AATALLFAIAQSSVAQEATDTIAAQQLQEVVIQAPRVIRKVDMDVYYPSKSAVENSKNGVQLLNNLMIPTLTVSDALGTIQAAGQSVQVRINGRESSIEQVRTLLPESIKRVEWIDNPGLRYGGANYVVNFIVSNPTVGGSLMVQARPALNQAWGFYMADTKFNTGRSQWEVGGNFKLTNKLKTHRDYTETFTYPDGTSLTRDETSRGGTLDNTQARAWASYSYIKPDTTVFMAEFWLNQNVRDKWAFNGLLSLSDGSDDVLLTDSHGVKGGTPSLSLYLQQHFAHKQMLIANFSSSLYFGRSYSDYIEQLPGAAGYLTDIHTNIKDRNQAYAIEADYIKNWSKGRFTTGASYSANRNRSQYETIGGEIFHQRQDKVYLFAEYFHRFGKWTTTAGMGVQYTDFLFTETNQGTHTWSLRPQATVTYSLNQNHNFRLNFTSWQSTPSLAETNIVPQQLDGFQWRVGNQDLKTANSYMLTFRYGFNAPRISGSFGVRAFTSPNAITPLLLWEGEKLITTYENSRGLQNLSFFLAPQIEIIPNWLTASGYIQFRMERMRGTGYTHHSNAWSGNANIGLQHWGFVLSGQYVRAERDLWGEKISWGENLNIIDLSYNWKSWQFSAGVIMPFGRYDQGSESLSKWNRNEQHMRLNMRMPYISVSYNLQWGRQKRGAQKLMEVDANADRSTAGGR
ncbi:MAG: outer membrane beta-barrel family protein, partial [Muribaculaceae bacterium]|nr:outer membrane beta-barrel family protein [Muribaculaceae bacterium]